MAQTVHLHLQANGVAIAGESSQLSLDRAGTIECLSFDHTVFAAREAGTGRATGRRQYRPLKIRKRIDASSPLLLKSLCNNERIEGRFCFYRPHPAGTGESQMFYSVTISDGYVESVTQVSEDASEPGLSRRPPLEEVTFVFNRISWTIEDGGATHEDSWTGA